ncbi:MAG: lactonase family protein [Acidobacteria bacterium]|nr:lactonase family protein [Acidobacteriota bacterium]
MLKPFGLLILLMALHTNSWARMFVYVSVSGENRIAVFRLDEKTGALEPAGSLDVDGSPGPIWPHPSRPEFFAALRSTDKLATLDVDRSTGLLSVAHETTPGASSAFVLPDPSGRFLLSAYYGAGKVMVHAIVDDGALSPQPLQVIETDVNAHCIRLDPSGRYAFVPHTGPNAMFQFRWDGQSGRLTANDPPRVPNTPPGAGPRHIFFHPTLPVAYTANEIGSSVTVHAFNPSNGTLDAVQTLSTLPEGFAGNNTCADVEVTPDGRFVYVSNRGHDSIAAFRVDKSSGRLEAIGQFPTERTPRSFNIDPSGRYMVAAGQSSGTLATYRLDAASGRLERLDTYEVGKSPAWVMIVDHGE